MSTKSHRVATSAIVFLSVLVLIVGASAGSYAPNPKSDSLASKNQITPSSFGARDSNKDRKAEGAQQRGNPPDKEVKTTPRPESSEEEDSPDIPPFARSVTNAEDYHTKRRAQIAMLRGTDDPRSARLRPLAIQEMERQERRARDDAKSGRIRPAISGTAWTPIGPAPLPNGQTETVSTAVSGRVSAIAVHPTNPNIAYVGAAQGGVYRTLDGGATWTAIFDSALTLAIGSIAIAPSQPTTVYVGTGEPQGSCDSFFGVGVYRITNAETTATLSGPFNLDGGAVDVFTGRAVGRIVVHPTNPDIIFASTTSGIGGLNCEAFGGGTVPPLPGRGLYRSTNATTSCTFTKLTTATGTNILPGNYSHTDVAMDPANPNRVLVTVNAPTNPPGGGTGGGIFVSTDALAAVPTFTRTLSLANVRIELALHSAAGTVNVYAASGESNGRLRRSTDGGATWSAVLAAANGFCGGQCSYDIAIAVSPNDPLIVMIGGNVTAFDMMGNPTSRLIARSINGGTAFTNVNSGVHADNHAVTFAPSDPNIVYMGTDGGIYKSTNNGQVWNSMNNTGFNATQFQSIAMHPTDAFFTIGGTQDNGTECLGPCGTNVGNTWVRADFGDGGHAVIDQNAVNTTTVTMYHTYFNQSNAKAYARVLTAANAQDNGWTLHGCGFTDVIANGFVCSGPTLFYAPMSRGPGNPNSLYFGADRLYRSTDSGTTMLTVSQTFTAAISAIGAGQSNDNARIIGLTDGRVFATTTGANPLTNVTNASMPVRGLGRVVIDPNSPAGGPFTAYATFTGFGVPAGQHIWKTTNLAGGAATWVASGTGIPDIPVNAIVIDPANSTHVYAGTDIGVYVSQNGGGSWTPFGQGLPRVAVFDMALQHANRILRVATHGRGIWEITPVAPTAAPASISGVITTPDGQPLAGVVIRLAGIGTSTRITDEQGRYRFDNVETDQFYTVTPSLANYRFSPALRSFSHNGNRTDAVFTAAQESIVAANAIDTTEFFVRQHYLDFLGREPDQGGFDYWSGQLNQCGADSACVRARRIDVSAAFFIEQEFQRTGAFIYRLYKGALGRQLSFAEFSADRGQVVEGPNLEATKVAFTNAFVARPEFIQRYQDHTTAASFVDVALGTVSGAGGVDLSNLRTELIAKYNSGSNLNQSRVLVIRDLAENAAFSQAVHNRVFVLMEYFGFLRRDPDAAGYNFWLNVLDNREPGNFRGMVCAFITSAEYQRRFSTLITRTDAECQ